MDSEVCHQLGLLVRSKRLDTLSESILVVGFLLQVMPSSLKMIEWSNLNVLMMHAAVTNLPG